MVGVARPISPGGLLSADPVEVVQLDAIGGDVRELQRKFERGMGKQALTALRP
jgi:hypothetical protein